MLKRKWGRGRNLAPVYGRKHGLLIHFGQNMVAIIGWKCDRKTKWDKGCVWALDQPKWAKTILEIVKICLPSLGNWHGINRTQHR